MRSRNRLTVLAGIITAVTLAACTPGETSDAAATTSPAASAAAATQEATKSTTEAKKPIDVRAKLVEQGFALKRIDAIETNSGYRVSPFQSPFDMSKNHVIGDGNVTCTFMITNATWKKGEALIKHQIFAESTVRVTGSMHTGDGAKTPSIVFANGGAEYVDVPFTELTPQWILGAFDLRRCGDLTLNGKK
jgi:hypothetical protein